MKYDVASITHMGKVRRVNQDRVLALTGRLGGAATALLAVADGMGGLACGEKASALAVEALQGWWDGRNCPMPLQQLSEDLDAAIYEAHRQVYYLAEQIGQQTGSTLSLVYFQENEFLIKQIGDSRVYLINDDHLRQLTTDQTWCNRMISTGELTPEEAARHRLRHALVNALGVSAELEIATQHGTAPRGMACLLCSDGFYHEAPLERLTRELKKTPPDQALRQLLEAVLEGSASDNASAVLCRVF